jgi:hypothetical protein
MDKYEKEIARGEKERRDKNVTKDTKLTVLHQNVQSISNKLIELDLVLKSNQKNIDVLCFTEHWVKEDYLKLIQIEQYKLVGHFSRNNYDNGGSCIYVKKKFCTKVLNFFRVLVWRRIFKCLRLNC